MMEPATGGFALSKLITGIAGLFGGVAISIFWQPKKIKQHGLLAGGAVIGAISFGFAYVFGGAVANVIGMNLNNADNALAIGTVIGAVAVGVVSFVAAWLEKREGQDIAEVIREVKKEMKGDK
jgi:high-affinity Fe2+/Pb2+ permease